MHVDPFPHLRREEEFDEVDCDVCNRGGENDVGCLEFEGTRFDNEASVLLHDVKSPLPHMGEGEALTVHEDDDPMDLSLP